VEGCGSGAEAGRASGGEVAPPVVEADVARALLAVALVGVLARPAHARRPHRSERRACRLAVEGRRGRERLGRRDDPLDGRRERRAARLAQQLQHEAPQGQRARVPSEHHLAELERREHQRERRREHGEHQRARRLDEHERRARAVRQRADAAAALARGGGAQSLERLDERRGVRRDHPQHQAQQPRERREHHEEDLPLEPREGALEGKHRQPRLCRRGGPRLRRCATTARSVEVAGVWCVVVGCVP